MDLDLDQSLVEVYNVIGREEGRYRWMKEIGGS